MMYFIIQSDGEADNEAGETLAASSRSVKVDDRTADSPKPSTADQKPGKLCHHKKNYKCERSCSKIMIK